MQDNAVATIDDTSNSSRASTARQAEVLLEPLVTLEAAPGDVVTAEAAQENLVLSTSAKAEPAPIVPPKDQSSAGSSDDLPADTAASVAAPPAAEPIQLIEGGSERLRGDSQTNISLVKLKVAVGAAHVTTFKEIIKRAEGVRLSSFVTPLPTTWSAYGSTEQLFTQMRMTIAEQALLSEQASSLLACWSLSTWFPDAMPLAPVLALSGSAEDGDRVLRTLSNLCRNPLRMLGINVPDLRTIHWDPSPTLLFYEPNLTKPKATFLGCSARRGYLQGRWNQYKDFYCSKAIYLGEDMTVGGKLQWSLQVNVAATTATGARTVPPLTDSTVQTLQNQLLGYRFTNLIKVENSTFDAQGLPADIRPIANALGACLVDSPKLQGELISLLAPQVEQRLVDRSSSLKGMTIEAILSLAHQGKSKLLAGNIATQVNCIAKARGELLVFKPENIGHALKMLGLITQRLGKDGRGLVVDQPTLIRVHELAQVHGVGLDPDDTNLHCPLCAENKRVM
jgi:hypothetical protein